MKKFIKCMLVALSLTGLNAMTLTQELESLTKSQYEEMIRSLKDGKDHDLSLTLAAIAWQESRFGKKVINTKDGKHGSFCKYQILAQTASNRHKLDIYHTVNKLMFDRKFCSSNAIDELTSWRRYHKGNWRKMVASYNAGYKSLDNPLGALYAEQVAIKLRVLERFIKKHNIEY